MSKKSLLNETVIRRWGKLANMPALTENFLDQLPEETIEEEEVELREEDDEMEMEMEMEPDLALAERVLGGYASNQGLDLLHALKASIAHNVERHTNARFEADSDDRWSDCNLGTPTVVDAAGESGSGDGGSGQKEDDAPENDIRCGS